MPKPGVGLRPGEHAHLWISDRGETFSYIERSPDHSLPSYAMIKEVCVRFGVGLDDRDPEMYQRIVLLVGNDEGPQAAIDAVAGAVDTIFGLSRPAEPSS